MEEEDLLCGDVYSKVDQSYKKVDPLPISFDDLDHSNLFRVLGEKLHSNIEPFGTHTKIFKYINNPGNFDF